MKQRLMILVLAVFATGFSQLSMTFAQTSEGGKLSSTAVKSKKKKKKPKKANDSGKKKAVSQQNKKAKVKESPSPSEAKPSAVSGTQSAQEQKVQPPAPPPPAAEAATSAPATVPSTASVPNPPLPAKAAPPTLSKPSIPVEWYEPEVADLSGEKEGRTRIVLSGITLPHSQVSLGQGEVAVIKEGGQVESLSGAEVLVTGENMVADADGFFEIVMDLPRAKVQLSIVINFPGDKELSPQTQNYQLNLDVKEQEVIAQMKEKLWKSPFRRDHYQGWFGTGVNYLRYTQSSYVIQSPLKYQSLDGPSFFAELKWKLGRKWDFYGGYKVSPGKADSSTSITVNKKDYLWHIFSAEGVYYPSSWVHRVFRRYKAELSFRGGLQHHIVPFISRTSDNPNAANFVTNTLTMGTFGLQAHVKTSSRWTYEVFMRYQLPLMSGNVFSIEPNFAFDGSLGAIYEVNKQWKIGGFWYGQWHDYGFKTDDPYNKAHATSPVRISGNQTLFFSNLELRAGYVF